MNADQQEQHVQSPSSPPLRTMLLAVFAPFIAIALLASPLALDALRHSLGL
jgi:hypothetical protein